MCAREANRKPSSQLSFFIQGPGGHLGPQFSLRFAIICFCVDHSCHQCGSPVESGVAFCPHCRAPQIRVPIGNTGGETTTTIDIPALPNISESFVDWRQALGAAALAGVFSAVITILFAGFFGIGIAAAGALAVYFYRRKARPDPMSIGAGARIGAISGLFGFAFFCLLVASAVALSHGTDIKAALLASLQQAAGRTQDPDMKAVMEKFKTPEGLMSFLSFFAVFIGTLFIGLSALGGALAASRGRRKVPR